MNFDTEEDFDLDFYANDVLDEEQEDLDRVILYPTNPEITSDLEVMRFYSMLSYGLGGHDAYVSILNSANVEDAWWSLEASFRKQLANLAEVASGKVLAEIASHIQELEKINKRYV